jgi:DNA repair exonuclease SbcCD ATPase subunit
MIKLQTLKIKNFMSIGNVAQIVNFDKKDLVLVLGENLDLGGNDNKNGVGKSSILNALSFVLYGWSLSSIKKDNLINKSNKKSMLVTLSFEVDGVSYMIERGRKPGIFKFIKDGKESEFTSSDEGETNESQGENKHTQEAIERLLGMSYEMFRHVVGLNTYVRPFLTLGAAEQRSLIEELFGITKLSEKADVLKEQIKLIKEQIKEEEIKITAIQEANKKIETNIKSLEVKSSTWEKAKSDKIESLQKSIVSLMNLDIDTELKNHAAKKEWIALNNEYKSVKKELDAITKEVSTLKINLDKMTKLVKTSNTKTCPVCSQEMDKHTHKKVHDEYESQLKDITDTLATKLTERDTLKELVDSVNQSISEMPTTFYETVEDAYNHKATLDNLADKLSNELESTNPYIYQIQSLKNDAIQEINYDNINQMVITRDHQEFLFKLLTNKDSFIRKDIIKENLVFLNQRLTHYLREIGLPHTVRFMPDLDVHISNFGEEFDFDNLSLGERCRLTFSLSLAFRDVSEETNQKINLLFIDEVTDQGFDASGTDNVLKILKNMSRDSNRNVIVISHKEEYIPRVVNVLRVTKENRFTTIEEEFN